MIEVEKITVRVGGQTLLKDVSVGAKHGEVIAILGPNGAGKTTLLRVISGDRAPTSGQVRMGGRCLGDWTLRERARVRAVVSQETVLEFPFRVRDVVLMGRTPHVERKETLLDEDITWRALQAVGLTELSDRDYTTLSGGEKQRVQLARALAQVWDAKENRYLLLDEPTSGLDIAHQHEALALARRMTRDESRTTVVAVLHDLNLAVQYADRILLLREGSVVAYGDALVVLNEDNIRRAFGVESVVVSHPRLAVPFVVPIANNKKEPRGEMNMNTKNNTEANALVDRWASLREEEPRLRQRDAAARLGVTEAELIAAHVGQNAVRLGTDWKNILQNLGTVGPVTGLTRNEYAVIERTGVYSNVEIEGPMGQVLDEGIDLRLFMSRWCVGFACWDETKQGTRRSLQFFDASGMAIHKVFLREESDVDAFEELVRAQRSESQESTLTIEPAPEPTQEVPDDEVDVKALHAGWKELKDTHEFIHLLRRIGVTRIQALRIATPWTQRVPVQSYRTVLESAVATELPIMVFVGNRGIIQIHTGPIKTVKAIDGWFNVLDPDFNLHLREDGVASAWVVRKPTVDGVVTSLELYDSAGETVAYFFSKRKPGQVEVDAWRELLAGLERITERTRSESNMPVASAIRQ